MLLLLLIVVNAYKQQIACIIGNPGRILLPSNLIDSRISILVVFQFQHNGGRIHVLPRNEHNIGKAFYPMFAFFAYRPYLSLEECYDLSFLFTMLFFYGICYFATFLILKRIHIGSNPNIRKPSSIISTIFDTVIFLVCTYGVLAIFLIDIRIILPLGDGFLGWLFQLIHPLKA